MPAWPRRLGSSTCGRWLTASPRRWSAAILMCSAIRWSKTAEAQTQAWEEHKENERRAQAKSSGKRASTLDGVAAGLPALLRALKLQRRAARVGFDWPDARDVLAKMQEELDEIRAELDGGRKPERVLDEVGDLLFVCANLARHLDVDPEAALRHANGKFERRFRHVEQRLADQGRSLAGLHPR